MALRSWNIASLCAGVGGLDLGIRIAEPAAHGVVFVEREAAAAAVLVARMEAGDMAPAPVWSDLATFDARPWRGVVDCVTSGDPCQPNSVAGKRGGADDDRFLIDQVLRVVDECRPHRLFRENVTGNADGQLAALVPALEEMGYRVAIGIFSAAEVGASHRRERLFVMADRAGEPGRLHARRRRPGEGSAHAGGPGGAVGDPECPERRSIGCPCGDHGQDGDAQRAEGADRAGASGAVLDNAQLLGWDARWPDHRGDDRNVPSAAGQHAAALADTCRTELERIVGRKRDAEGWEEQDGYSVLCGGAGLFAPSPADPRWPSILADTPQLEPAVRRVADGLAHRGGPASRLWQRRRTTGGGFRVALSRRFARRRCRFRRECCERRSMTRPQRLRLRPELMGEQG